MLVKVCGVRTQSEQAIVSRHADATGIVVESASHRSVALPRARTLLTSAEIPTFLVSTCASAEGWDMLIEQTGATRIQIHTDEIEPSEMDRIRSRHGVFIMKAFSVPSRSNDPRIEAARISREIGRFDADMVLLDTGRGTGRTHDLRISRLVARDHDIVLAGGLGPDTVAEAIAFVDPYGVDASSGTENNGSKEERLVARFTANARGVTTIKEESR